MPYYNPYLYSPQMQTSNLQGTQMSFTNQQNNNGLIWVQGEAGAKSYMVPPNSTVMLMDSENQRFYIKSTDISGMPQPLRVFEYTESTQRQQNTAQEHNTIDYSSFVTKAEFDAFKGQIEGMLKGGMSNAKSSVRRTEQESEPEG